MFKFKKGDRVRCRVDCDPGEQFTRGKDYVLRQDSDDYCSVVADDSDRPNGLPVEDFELVAPQPAFKVGDRVRITDRTPYADAVCIGDSATITHAPERCDGLYTLNIDTSEGGTLAQVGYANQLELIAEPATLTIEAGKFYKTRDGRKVVPMEHGWDGNMKAGGRRWWNDGRANSTIETSADLIAEWVDEEPATKASNDNAPKFQVGDRVVATRDDIDITAGETYTIVEVDDENEEEPIGVNDDAGDLWWMSVDDFEPAPTPTTAIVAMFEDGRPKPAPRPVVHETEADAIAEAERLAGNNPGTEFGVFILTTKRVGTVSVKAA